MAVDWLFTNAHLLTMEGDGIGHLADGAVAVTGNLITAVGPTAQVRQQLGLESGVRVTHEVDCQHHVIMPGLIDAHIHTQLGLLRGIAQDMHDWMMRGIMPYLLELKPRWQQLSAELSIMEGLCAGTTTFGDFLSFPDPQLFQFYESSGIRVRPILPVHEIGPALLSGGELYTLDRHMGQASYNEALRLYDEFHGTANGRIQCMLGPFTPDFVSEDTLVRVKEAAVERGVHMQMHCAQGERETRQIQLRHGKRSVPYLDDHQYFDSKFTAVHMTDANDEEVHCVASRGRISSCATAPSD